MTDVVFEKPPLWSDITRKFHVEGKPVIFAWGDRIYNPMRVTIHPALMAHEEVHCERQLRTGVLDWWEQYLISGEFRLQEEIPAHLAEYLYLSDNAANRQQRRRALKETARRLASPLYGSLIPRKRAAEILNV